MFFEIFFIIVYDFKKLIYMYMWENKKLFFFNYLFKMYRLFKWE